MILFSKKQQINLDLNNILNPFYRNHFILFSNTWFISFLLLFYFSTSNALIGPLDKILFPSQKIESTFPALIGQTKGTDAKTVFVQLFEWPWLDIARECEIYLGPYGFAAVQVSPPQEHVDLLESFWWARYQPVSYEIISRSGNESQFKEMVQRCAKQGVDVYVDTIVNHMTGYRDGKGIAGTHFEHYRYPNIYETWDFHHCGRNGNDYIQDYKDLYEIQNCELLGLADLKTDSYHVQSTLASYINKLLSFGVKGLRIDAAKHVPVIDLKNIFSLVKGDPYIYQELFVGIGEPVSQQDYLSWQDVNVFAYPFLIGDAFNKKAISGAINITQYLPPSEKAIVFLENHDLQRLSSSRSDLLSYRLNPRVFYLASVFMLTWPYGYPQLYSSYNYKNNDDGPPVDSMKKTLPILMPNGDCRAPWICEHRLQGMAALALFRNFTDSDFRITSWWNSGADQIAFSRGRLGFVAINLNEKTEINARIHTDLTDGVYCNIIENNYIPRSNRCDSGYKVENGFLQLHLLPLQSIVLQANTIALSIKNLERPFR